MEWGWLAIPAAAALYCVVSAVLFIWPCCRKSNRIDIKHSPDRIVLGAHRGGSIERTGMHILEMDVQLTKDKHVVVHHDPSLKRMTGLDKTVAELNYDEIPKALDEVPDMFGVNYYKLKPGIDDGRIPLLRDVFAQHPGVHINIDLKGGDDDLMEQVYKLIVEFDRQDTTYFGDMNEAKNVKALRHGSQTGVRTFASIKYTLLTIVAYFCCVLQCLPFRHWSFWYPFFGADALDTIKRRFGDSCRLRTIVCVYRAMTWCMKPMFWHLRRRGVLVMFWNVNTETEYNRALTYSIDGLLTDRPEYIRSIADKRLFNPEHKT